MEERKGNIPKRFANARASYNDHLLLREWYHDRHSRMEENLNFSISKQWNDEELEFFKRKNKAPVVMNMIKPAERTAVGLMIENKHDVGFQGTEPNDQDVSDVLAQLYMYTRHMQRWEYLDPEVFRQGWITGVGYQEVYVDTANGIPKIKTQNLNPLAIYFDPNSIDLITRTDAAYVRRETWVDIDYAIMRFPELEEDEFLSHYNEGDTTFESYDKYADRRHEFYDTVNGRVKFVETFYKTYSPEFCYMDEEGNRQVIDRKEQRDYKAMGYEIYREDLEVLNLSIMCPAWRNDKFLFNDEYHTQPRNPQTNKIMFPILEFCIEQLNGEPFGIVDHMKIDNKMINGVISNRYHGIKHSASTSYLRDKAAFEEDDARDFDRNHSDGDRVFVVKEGRAANAVAPIPRGTVSPDHDSLLQTASGHIKEVASTPPALQGIQESTSTSGILNAQRIEQAYVQQAGMNQNWQAFLRHRATLCMHYWREYWSDEKTFRVVDKGSKSQSPDFVTINQQVPVRDHYGNLTGAIQKLNDINTGTYDVTIGEAKQSLTLRMQTVSKIAELLQSPAVQADPGIMAALLLEFIRLTDMPQDLKDQVMQSSQMRQQMMQAQQQAQTAQAQLAARQQEHQVAEMDAADQVAQEEADGGAGVEGVPNEVQGRPDPANPQNMQSYRDLSRQLAS